MKKTIVGRLIFEDHGRLGPHVFHFAAWYTEATETLTVSRRVGLEAHYIHEQHVRLSPAVKRAVKLCEEFIAEVKLMPESDPLEGFEE